MIARQYRFHGYNALRFVYKQGKTARSSVCLLRYAANPQRRQCRVAVVVAKKVHKSAVGRNRIRRRIYAVIEQRVGDWPPYDLVFTVIDGAIQVKSQKDIENTITRLLQMTGLEPQPVDK
jgi:ribonuclease P protein component